MPVDDDIARWSEKVRAERRTQVREISFADTETYTAPGVEMSIPSDPGARSITAIQLNVRELKAWGMEMLVEASRRRRLRWRPWSWGGTTHVALIDPDDPENPIEIGETRYGSVQRAKEECVHRNRLRREEMTA